MSEVTQSEFLDAFGITPEAPAETPPDPPVAEPDPPEPDAKPDAIEPDATEPETPDATEPPKEEDKITPVPDKAAAAFAQMRVENATFKKTMESVAALLGITDVKDPTALAEAVKGKVLEAQAKKDNVPVEILQRLSQLEAIEESYTKQTLQTQAALGFQAVKNEYGLKDEELVAFAQSLVGDGINPYEQSIDLVAEYRNRNWQLLIKKAEDRARAAELARSEKARAHGSEPGTHKGSPPGEQGKINTVKELTDFFNKGQ